MALKKYAIIEHGEVVNIVVANDATFASGHPTWTVEEIPDVPEVGWKHDGAKFIKPVVSAEAVEADGGEVKP